MNESHKGPVMESTLAEIPPSLHLFADNPHSDKTCELPGRIKHDTKNMFLPDLHHMQMEPLYGGVQDTVKTLYGAGNTAPGNTSHFEAMFHPERLLGDTDHPN